MKKIIITCFLSLIVCNVSAQNKKPTKEQTAAYIKDYYLNNTNFEASELTDTSSKRTTIFKNVIEFSEDYSVITYSYEFQRFYLNMDNSNNFDKIFKYKIIIDLKKIEQITVKSFRPYPGGDLITRLEFKAAPGYAIKQYESEENKDLPQNPKEAKTALVYVNSYECKECDYPEIDKKIMQAFDHLRKLSGAPEAIEFGN